MYKQLANPLVGEGVSGCVEKTVEPSGVLLQFFSTNFSFGRWEDFNDGKPQNFAHFGKSRSEKPTISLSSQLYRLD